MSFKTSLKEYLRRLETFNDSLQNNFDLEAIRLESFKHCNTLSTHFSYIRLAADGFYFDKELGKIVCFGCSINVSDGYFRQGKSITDIHRSTSPSCRYISPIGSNTQRTDLLDMEKMPVHSTRQLSLNKFGKNHRPTENTNGRSAVELTTVPIRTPTQDLYELNGGAASTFETEQAHGGSTQMIVDESNYLDSPAARAVIELSTRPERTKKHVEEALGILNRDQLRPTAVQIARLVYTLEERDNEIEKLVTKIEKNKLDQSSERTCVICLHREKNIVFCPCGHVLCCAQCSDKLRRQDVNPKCPTCRTIINHCTRIYLS